MLSSKAGSAVVWQKEVGLASQQITMGEARAQSSLTSLCDPLAPSGLSRRHTELSRSVSNLHLSPLCPFGFVSCSTDITPENTLWVGAWWIGFLGAGAASLLISIPILGYPPRLPGTQLEGTGTGTAWCSHSPGGLQPYTRV